jgi:hypothetical protein
MCSKTGDAALVRGIEETLTMTPPAAAQHVRQRRVAAIHHADQIRLD